MAITDHFKAVEDPGFRRTVEPEAARQQLHMSLGLVVLLAIAAAAIGLSFRFEPQVLEARINAPVRLVVQMPQHVNVLQAARKSTELPGG
jgi:hypothetical protein